MKLLIVDRDRDQVEMLASWLKTLGHEVHRAYTAEQAKSEWEKREPDFVILDTALGHVDGLKLCKEMQQKHDALVLVLTYGTTVYDEIRSLQEGADGYLRKPFLPGQLLAHIQSISRRTRTTVRQQPSSIINVGPIQIDVMHNEVTVSGKIVHLTRTESKLLHLLAVNVNNICTTEQIISYVWGLGYEGDTGLIKAHIRHLRLKIEPDPVQPRYILTVPAVGYTLNYYPVGTRLTDTEKAVAVL